MFTDIAVEQSYENSGIEGCSLALFRLVGEFSRLVHELDCFIALPERPSAKLGNEAGQVDDLCRGKGRPNARESARKGLAPKIRQMNDDGIKRGHGDCVVITKYT